MNAKLFDIKMLYQHIFGIEHFTILHFCSAIITILAILGGVFYFHFTHKKETETNYKIILDEEDNKKNGLQAKYKMARQKFLEKQLSINRSQRVEEERMLEQQTLKTVMELLQQQSKNGSTLSMDELQEQLDMYRTQA